MLISIKFNDDQYFDNAFYAKVGGVTCRELNKLEREILGLLDFDLAVDPELYQKYKLTICDLRASASTISPCPMPMAAAETVTGAN